MSEGDDRTAEDAGDAIGEDSAEHAGLIAVLDALEQAVTRARAVPMSSTVLVNRVEVLDLLDQAYAVLPAQLGQAEEVLADAEAVREEADAALAAAQQEAEQVIAAARRRAEELVGVDEVTVAARLRAGEIVADAERTAQSLRRDADDYCDQRLADLERDLGTVLAQVQSGRARLADRLTGGE